MEKHFVTKLTEFINVNGKEILEQPERFKSLFLDFSKNQYRAETQVFSQFLASKEIIELKDSNNNIDAGLMKSVAQRFEKNYLFSKSACEMVVLAYSMFSGFIDKKTFEKGLSDKKNEITEKSNGENINKNDESEKSPLQEAVMKLKKTPKRFWVIFAILAFICLIVVISLVSTQRNDFHWSGIGSGRIAITSYVGASRTIEIPSTINRRPVSRIQLRAFNNRNLTYVKIPDSITHIGDHAFANNRLTSIIIPNSVINIGEGAFHNNLLTSIQIGANVDIPSLNAFGNGFEHFYWDNNRAAGIYTRHNASSSDWSFCFINDDPTADNGLPLDEDFLLQNSRRPSVVTTSSGLQYEVIRRGNGPRPGLTDIVRVHYEGTLIDGTIFDSSIARGFPIEFSLDMLIPGWTEGLQLMNVGSRFRLFIPHELGYGSMQAGMIPPFSTLIFEIELLDILGQNQ